MERRLQGRAAGIEQHVIDAPGIHAQAGEVTGAVRSDAVRCSRQTPYGVTTNFHCLAAELHTPADLPLQGRHVPTQAAVRSDAVRRSRRTPYGVTTNNRPVGEAVNLCKRQQVIFQPAEHNSSAAGPKVDGKIVVCHGLTPPPVL